METWNPARIQQYIDNHIEESTTLEYKGALALDNSPAKKKEIAKDVSAMANAAGGVLIYGINEFQEKDKRHLPEKIDPIDRTLFSREWLSQIIHSNIQPHIDGLQIFPVALPSAPNHVVYVIEIPQSSTAHQVTADADCRYYERINFEVARMEDYRIRDVMHRAQHPNIEVEFAYRMIQGGYEEHVYELLGKITNPGPIAVNYFKLEFTFPDLDRLPRQWRLISPSLSNTENSKTHPLVAIENQIPGLVTYEQDSMCYRVVCRSAGLLFPNDSENIGHYIKIKYYVNREVHANAEAIPSVEWTLFADNMKPKQGKIPFYELHNF